MIKYIKYFIFVLFVWIWFINFSNAWYTRQIWTYWYNPYAQSFDVNLTYKWNPLTQSLWYTKQLFLITSNDRRTYLWFWHSSWVPYIYQRDKSCSSAPFRQWIIKQFQICDQILDPNSSSKPWNCSEQNVWDWTSEILWNFMNSLLNTDYYYFETRVWNWCSYAYFDFCISNQSVWNSFCFRSTSSYVDTNNSLGLVNELDFSTFPTDVLSNPPGWYNPGYEWNQGNNWIAIWSDLSAINYYEKHYWRNKNICYVWIDNVTDLWWSSKSFQEWKWLTIFEAFEDLYWNQDLDKVYVWINSQLLNYEQWFNREWNPLYLSTYNSWTNSVDLYYDNLTFPFANKPLALYFMASNINSKSEESTNWSSVVSYCNMVLNEWSFEDIIDEADKQNINVYTENQNKANWLQADWTNRLTSNILSWVAWSWHSYTWDVDMWEFFQNSLSEMKKIIDTADVNPFTWVLPNYIIFGFLLVVLFKVLRK